MAFQPRTQNQMLVQKLQRVMAFNPSADRALALVAEETGLTAEQVGDAFEQETGETLHVYEAALHASRRLR